MKGSDWNAIVKRAVGISSQLIWLGNPLHWEQFAHLGYVIFSIFELLLQVSPWPRALRAVQSYSAMRTTNNNYSE